MRVLARARLSRLVGRVTFKRETSRLFLPSALLPAQRARPVADLVQERWALVRSMKPGVSTTTKLASDAHDVRVRVKSQLWSRLTDECPRYANYQARTSREIPLTVVETSQA